jgi:hypothetical protein
MPLLPNEVLITSANFRDHFNPVVDGVRQRHGLIPRDRSIPTGMRTYRELALPIIPKGEWQARLDALVASKSLLSDVRNRGMFGQPIPSRDQNGRGYCWAHSGVSAHLVRRAVDGDPYADLSAYAVACIIKDYRDEGGNGIDGIQFQQERGCPTSQFWPQQSASRSNDNPQTWANAAKHKYVSWVQLDSSQMEEQMVSCLLLGWPLVVDYNWWSHSVCAVDVVEIGKTGRIWNSWGDKWSANGMGSLEWRKFIADDAWACISVTASAA